MTLDRRILGRAIAMALALSSAVALGAEQQAGQQQGQQLGQQASQNPAPKPDFEFKECSTSCKKIELGGPVTISREPAKVGKYRIQLVNVLRKQQYVIETELQVVGQQIPDPISLDDAGLQGDSPPASCQTQTDALLAKVAAATKENEIYVLGVRKALDESLSLCTDPKAKKAAEDRFNAARTLEVEKQFEIGEGEDLVVKVTRMKEDGTVAQQLGSFTFATPRTPPGRLLTYYGFNYVKSDDKLYFSQANTATPPGFVVTPMADRSNRDFMPSVYFMWFKEKNHSWPARVLSGNKGDVFWGATAGLGFDFDSPTAFLGYGLGWGYNIMFTGGVVMRKVNRLSGRYEPGQVVAESLSEAQLGASTYKPAGYVGLAIRFGESPLKAAQSPASATPSSTDPAK